MGEKFCVEIDRVSDYTVKKKYKNSRIGMKINVD